jgi:hypothetical protein
MDAPSRIPYYRQQLSHLTAARAARIAHESDRPSGRVHRATVPIVTLHSVTNDIPQASTACRDNRFYEECHRWFGPQDRFRSHIFTYLFWIRGMSSFA